MGTFLGELDHKYLENKWSVVQCSALNSVCFANNFNVVVKISRGKYLSWDLNPRPHR